MPEIKILATDLDGTLVGGATDLPFYPAFRDCLSELKRRYGTIWVVCTGRSRSSFHDFFTPLKILGLRPDYVIVRHAYIYGVTSLGYIPHLFWNICLAYVLHRKKAALARWLRKWHSMARHLAHGSLTLHLDEDRLWIKFGSEEAAETVAKLLKQSSTGLPHVRVERSLLDVEAYALPYTKGMAVAELASHLGVPNENILAVGNGHNDISMLDGSVAAMTGCPSNSEREVMEAVARAGGHVSERKSIEGLIDIIESHLGSKVRSLIPATNGASEKMPRRRKPRRHSSHSSRAAGMALAIAALYAVMLAFASVDLFPFASVVMKPYWLVLSLVEKIIVVLGSR